MVMVARKAAIWYPKLSESTELSKNQEIAQFPKSDRPGGSNTRNAEAPRMLGQEVRLALCLFKVTLFMTKAIIEMTPKNAHRVQLSDEKER